MNKFYCNGLTLKNEKCKKSNSKIENYYCHLHKSQESDAGSGIVTKEYNSKPVCNKCDLCKLDISKTSKAYHNCDCGVWFHNTCIRNAIKTDENFDACFICNTELPDKFTKNIIKQRLNSSIERIKSFGVIKNRTCSDETALNFAERLEEFLNSELGDI